MPMEPGTGRVQLAIKENQGEQLVSVKDTCVA